MKDWVKAEPDLTQDIAYICEILHSNHFIILSDATAYETTTINRCPSTAVVSMIHPVYWKDHRNHHSAGTSIDCRCLISSGIAENDEMVAVEDFIYVGNILGKSWVGLCRWFSWVWTTKGISHKTCEYLSTGVPSIQDSRKVTDLNNCSRNLPFNNPLYRPQI